MQKTLAGHEVWLQLLRTSRAADVKLKIFRDMGGTSSASWHNNLFLARQQSNCGFHLVSISRGFLLCAATAS
jgi:hypothetical protein